MLQEGTLIAGRYELHSPLASGGNGLVFAAKDLTTEKRVAVKVLGPHMLHERSAREKLRLEAIVAGRVESEHIVQVSDAGVDVNTGTPFLVMELLKGLDLQRHVDQHGPLEHALAIEFLRQVASGLDKAHAWKDLEGRAAPIVHRDLKPENLFLTYREDGSPLVKILDFGLAKVLSVSATLSSEIKGTPLYMAPEQFSQLPVTPATDIWALGLIAFFFLVGKPYWLCARDDRAVLPAVIKEVSEGVVEPATERVRQLDATVSLPEAFNDWFAQCVNLDPKRRFSRASSAVKALATVLDSPLVSSPLASVGLLQPGARPSVTDLGPTAPHLDRPSTTGAATTSREQSPRAPFSRFVLAALILAVAVVLVFSMRRFAPSEPARVQGSESPRHSAASASQHAAPVTEPVPATVTSHAPTAEQSSIAPSASVSNQPKEKTTGVSVTRPGSNPPQPAASSATPVRTRPIREAPHPAVSTVSKTPATPSPSDRDMPPQPSAASRARRDPADHR